MYVSTAYMLYASRQDQRYKSGKETFFEGLIKDVGEKTLKVARFHNFPIFSRNKLIFKIFPDLGVVFGKIWKSLKNWFSRKVVRQSGNLQI